MGGMGSGRRWYWGAKNSTGNYRSIDVRRWKREGLLTPHQSFVCLWERQGEVLAAIRVRTDPDRVILDYRHRRGSEDWQDESYPVYLDWTAAHLGGKRTWFRCPADGCGQRVTILYVGGIFACRRCYRLTYPSQRETGYNRLARWANKLRDKLGWEPGFLNGNGGKPKGMHWNTFERLVAQHEAFVQRSLAEVTARYHLPLPW